MAPMDLVTSCVLQTCSPGMDCGTKQICIFMQLPVLALHACLSLLIQLVSARQPQLYIGSPHEVAAARELHACAGSTCGCPHACVIAWCMSASCTPLGCVVTKEAHQAGCLRGPHAETRAAARSYLGGVLNSRFYSKHFTAIFATFAAATALGCVPTFLLPMHLLAADADDDSDPNSPDPGLTELQREASGKGSQSCGAGTAFKPAVRAPLPCPTPCKLWKRVLL